MRLPRFRLRTLMITVAAFAVLFAVWAVIEGRRERSKWATVRVVNRRSSPLRKVQVIGPSGQQEIPQVPPGEEVGIPIRIESQARVRVDIDGRRHAEWFQVRGGSQPTLTLSD